MPHVDGGGDERLQALAAPQVERVQEGPLRLRHVTPHLQASSRVKANKAKPDVQPEVIF